MIKAIVYTSNSGFTKRYAEMLGEEIKVPVYEFKESKKKLNRQDEIIYMGWIMAGTIKNYKKANKLYVIKAVCPVGMTPLNEKQNSEMLVKNNITAKMFYLQGGFDKAKLTGIYRFMMDSLEKMVKPQIEGKEEKTKEDLEMLEMMDHGKDCVDKKNLDAVIKWINENKETL